MLENNQRNLSSRRDGMRLSAATLNRITREELRCYPYKIKVRHHLKENDSQRRFSILVTGFSSNVITLKMNGTINTWKVREYALKGQVLEFIFERDDWREKITVRPGLYGNGTLLGPYIFDGTVNGYNYLQMINDFTFPQL